MLGGFLLLRRAMLDELGGFDAGLPHVRRGHRPLLPRGEGGLGALVRARRAVVTHRWDAVTDRALLDAADALALARHAALRAQAPERLRASVRRPRSTTARRRAGPRSSTPILTATSRHRAELVVALGPRARAGRHGARPRVRRRRARGAAARARASLHRRRPLAPDGRAAARRGGWTPARRRPERLRAAAPVAATTCFRALYYARDRARVLPARRRVTRRRSSSSTSIRGSTRCRRSSPSSRRRAYERGAAPVSRPQNVALPATAARLRGARADAARGARPPLPLHLSRRGEPLGKRARRRTSPPSAFKPMNSKPTCAPR